MSSAVRYTAPCACLHPGRNGRTVTPLATAYARAMRRQSPAAWKSGIIAAFPGVGARNASARAVIAGLVCYWLAPDRAAPGDGWSDLWDMSRSGGSMSLVPFHGADLTAVLSAVFPADVAVELTEYMAELDKAAKRRWRHERRLAGSGDSVDGVGADGDGVDIAPRTRHEQRRKCDMAVRRGGADHGGAGGVGADPDRVYVCHLGGSARPHKERE
jgi:hypothetical protein